MKKILLFIIVCLITLSNSFLEAQDKRFTVSTYTDVVATKKDGFNIGASIDYQMNLMYFKAQVFTFPDLRGVTYTEISGTPLGFNLHLNDIRAYAGLKLGVILRGSPFATYGGELGVDYYFNKIGIGVMLSRDRRTDGKIWGVTPYWRDSGFVKLIFEI